jgi:glycine/D-amino acid oxidase-like deaminating enzyme
MRSCDYLIVGGGIAGLTLANYLQQSNQNFLVVNADLPGAATKVSSGVINPVTGQRFVLSWNYEELKTEFLRFYKRLEIEFSESFIKEMQLCQILRSAEEQNLWLSRSADPVYQPYFGDVKLKLSDLFYSDQSNSIGIIKSMYVVQIEKLIAYLTKDLLYKDRLVQSHFLFDEFIRTNDELVWKDIHIHKAIVFAEGFRISSNPYFNWLPVLPLKGECLKIEIPDSTCEAVYKSDYAVVPLTENIYWIGSNFYLFETELGLTEEEKQNQLCYLERIISKPFLLKEHLYGIRPASRDRRPILGAHPFDPRLIVFNGLGTKGLSLAPYCSKHLSDYLVNDWPIPKELNLNRFFSKGYHAAAI